MRYTADNWNKLKNLCSKQIGEKMKVLYQIEVSTGHVGNWAAILSQMLLCALVFYIACYSPHLFDSIGSAEFLLGYINLKLLGSELPFCLFALIFNEQMWVSDR